MPRFAPIHTESGPIDPAIMTAPLPTALWIELTSKCPFDCIFCSRKTLRGNGEHMEFALFESIVQQLDRPEIIRLNYSGESIHYPHLIEAIRLARGTGAFTELVTALASLPLEKIEPLVRSGLGRMTVSLHTLDESEFTKIYGFGTVHDMRKKLLALRTCQRSIGTDRPILDFAFVGMKRNLDQLNRIAEFAQELGISEISVHPVIRRDDIRESFDLELRDGKFLPTFQRELNATVEIVRERNPNITIALSTRELERSSTPGPQPQHTPGHLPGHARIYSCDQNPWETIHVLSNGDVVVCEVREKVVMGNLQETSLKDIWHGRPFREFRQTYQFGRTHPCAACAYKMAYVPGQLGAGIDPGRSNDSQLLRGWYPPEHTLAWSKQSSSAVLFSEPGASQFRFRGILPAGPNVENELLVHCNGGPIGTVRNAGTGALSFDLAWDLPISAVGQLRIDFTVRHVYRPTDRGLDDFRALGFALLAMSVSRPRHPIESLKLALPVLATQCGRALAFPLMALPRKRTKRLDWSAGISIVIPERSTPDLLDGCIRSALAAAERLGEPAELIVVVNGVPLESYVPLQREYPTVRWLHFPEPLGFLKAISEGLAASRFDWVYLLNSDMTLEPTALAEIGAWRGTDVFAIASQIFFTDTDRRREETGWTGASTNGRRVDIFDVVPEDPETVRTHLYAGGGASLFRRDLLLEFTDSTDPYGPFYWEDVEWGFRALTAGYQVLFCPRSHAHHLHRATVRQFYTESEIRRIFARNSWLFALRNGFWLEPPSSLLAEIRLMDSATQGELSSLAVAASLVRNLCSLANRRSRGLALETLRNGFVLKPLSRTPARPRILLVTPYVICPANHGGARRIVDLLEHLGKEFDIIVLTDEGTSYYPEKLKHLRGVAAIHLIDGRPDGNGGQDRIRRIQTHSHETLQAEVKRLTAHYSVDLVQIEYMELAGLIEARASKVPWFITLHDVLTSAGGDSRADRFEAGLLSRFSGIAVCTEEDAVRVPGAEVVVIPNGARKPGGPYRPSRGNQTILFAGPFRYKPNQEGIINFLECVYPRLVRTFPALNLDILGGNEGVAIAQSMRCFEQPGVHVHPFAEDVRPFLERCALTINPLHRTRGSSIKLIESIAHGRVCVSTKEAASGFVDRRLAGLVLADRIEDFTTIIQELLANEEARIERECPPPDLCDRFGWEKSAALQTELYRKYLR